MKTVLLWLQRLFLLFSIAFLIYVFVQNRRDIVEVFSAVSMSGIVLGMGFWILATLVIPLIALTVLRDRGNTISYSTLLFIHLNRIPSKFLPGGVWQTVARAYDMNSLGISRRDISLVVLHENSYLILLAALISTLGIYLLDSNALYSKFALALFIGSLLTIPTAFVFRKRSFILSISAYTKLTLVCACFWMAAMAAFYSYMSSIPLIAASYKPLLMVVHYLFSYVVGFVSIFAPQGIGVFEVVVAELADLDMPFTQVVILVAGFRVLIFLSDIVSWAIYMLLRSTGKIGEIPTN